MWCIRLARGFAMHWRKRDTALHSVHGALSSHGDVARQNWPSLYRSHPGLMDSTAAQPYMPFSVYYDEPAYQQLANRHDSQFPALPQPRHKNCLKGWVCPGDRLECALVTDLSVPWWQTWWVLLPPPCWIPSAEEMSKCELGVGLTGSVQWILALYQSR